MFPRDGLLIPKESREAESGTAESSWPRSAVKWPDVFFSFLPSFSSFPPPSSSYFSPTSSSFSSSSYSVCQPGERNFHEVGKTSSSTATFLSSPLFLFFPVFRPSTEIDLSVWSFSLPRSVPKELTEGHEQSRNEPGGGEGNPLISWLAASTSIFRRSNNGRNVPLKIHLVIGGPLSRSFSLLSFFFFFFPHCNWNDYREDARLSDVAFTICLITNHVATVVGTCSLKSFWSRENGHSSFQTTATGRQFIGVLSVCILKDIAKNVDVNVDFPKIN